MEHQNLNYFTRTLAAITISIVFSSCTNEVEQSSKEPTRPKEKVSPKTPKSEYTEIDAGEWEGIKDSHLPQIKIISKSKKENIEIKINGEFTEEHYIERIGIMDENKQDLAGIDLQKKQIPSVKLTLDPIPENPKIKIYVKCNLHDMWTKPLLPSNEN